MNNEIIQAIREEIARLQPNAPKPGNMKSVDAKVAMQVHARLNKLLSFLSDLETKVADGEELNWEIEKYFADWEDDSEYGQAVMRDGACAGVDECKDIARHFYYLGCRRTAEKYDEIEYNRQRASGSSEIPNDLEEAAEEYKQGEIDTGEDYRDEDGYPLCFMEALKPAFIAGAKWNRVQMMKDGLEAVKSGQSNKIEKTIAGVFVKYGMDRQKEKMMKEAVEGYMLH